MGLVPQAEGIWVEVLERWHLLDQTPLRELVFEDLNALIAAPGAEAPNLTGNWLPGRGAGRLAHGIPLVAELKNYTWRLSLRLGMGEEGEAAPIRESPKHFVMWLVVHRRAESLERQCPFVCYLRGIARHSLIPRWQGHLP